MATSDQLSSIVGCLSATYPAFVSQQLTKLAMQAQGVLEAATDPLASLMDQNVSALVGDSSQLAQGDVISNVTEAGIGVLYNEVIKQQLTAALNAVYAKYPAAKSFVEFAENSAESAIGLIHLFLSLNVEAPYALAQITLEAALPAITQKQRIIGCITEHVAQISNTMLTLSKDPRQANLQMKLTISKLLKELQGAQLDFRTCIANLQQANLAAQGLAPGQLNFTATGGFLVNRFKSGQVHLQNADIVLSPILQQGNTVLTYASPLLDSAAGPEFLTNESRQLSLVLLGSLVGMMKNMMTSLAAVTDLVNLYISAVKALTGQLTALQANQKLNALRLKLLQGIDTQLTSLITQVTKPQTNAATYSILAINWSSTLRALRAQTDKVINATLSDAGVSAADQRLIALRAALNKVLTSLETLSVLPNIIGANDDLTTLQQRMTTFLGAADTLMDRVSSADDPTQQDQVTRSLVALMKQVAPLGISIQARLKQSSQFLIELVPIINEYLAIDIPIKAQIQQIILILDKAGMSRASDLLRAGNVTDFMKTSYMTATYAGFAAECLVNDIANAPDSQTAQDLQDLLDDANSELLTAAITSSDILNGGQNQYYANLQAQIQAVNRNAQLAQDIISRMETLAKKIGTAVASGAVTATLARAINSAGSDLDTALRNVTTAGLGFPGCD